MRYWLNQMSLPLGIPWNSQRNLYREGVKETNNMNRVIADEANQTQLEITDKNIAAQLEQLEKNLSWQEKMFDEGNEYNSIESQVQRALRAGVNPASIASHGGNTPASSVPSSPSAGISPQMPNLHVPTMIPDYAEKSAIFNSITDFLSSAAKTGMDYVQLQPTLNSLNASAQLQINQASNVAAQTVGQMLDNGVFLKYGDKKFDAEVRKIMSDINVSNSQTDVNKAEEALKKAEEGLARSKTKTEDELRAPTVGAAKANVEYVKEKAKTERSQQNLNYTTAQDIKDTKDARIRQMNSGSDLNDSIKRLNDLDFEIRDFSKAEQQWQVMSDAINGARRGGLINAQIISSVEMQLEHAKLAAKDGKWYEWKQIMNSTRDFLIGVGMGAGAYKSLKTTPTPYKPNPNMGFH